MAPAVECLQTSAKLQIQTPVLPENKQKTQTNKNTFFIFWTVPGTPQSTGCHKD
jgi:hypothetical protein